MSVNKRLTQEKITITSLKKLKEEGKKISMLTAYDFTTASIIDEVGIEMTLVGDSAANVVLGYETTLPMELDEMIFMAKSVRRGVKNSFMVVDMPFGSYQASEEKAMENAIRIMKETQAEAVKLEGGENIVPIIKKLTQAGIPVVGHLGLTPQSVHQFGGFEVRAKQEEEAEKLRKDAKLLEEAGCFSVVLEKIPQQLATKITEELRIITIGIGAGNGTDGQVLVTHDMLGLIKDFKPKFVRQFTNLREKMLEAFENYQKEVRTKNFPNQDECY